MAEQAKILVAEAEEDNWDDDRFMPRWRRWDTCSLCEQDYHGFVLCALGWACWKTYVGRPEVDPLLRLAMTQLGNGLADAQRHAEALSVQEADVSTRQRLNDSAQNILSVQDNLATSLSLCGQPERSLSMFRDIYARRSALLGKNDEATLLTAGNLASTLLDDLEQFDEAKAFLEDRIPEAIRALGKNNGYTFRLQRMYAQCLFLNDGASRSDLTEAISKLEDLDRRQTRIYGAAHPQTCATRRCLEAARKQLARA